MILDYIDILVVAETKLDASFPKNQFLIPGFKTPYRLDVSDKSSGLLVYVKDCLLRTEIKVDYMSPDMQVIPFELNTRKKNGCYYRYIDLQIKIYIFFRRTNFQAH